MTEKPVPLRVAHVAWGYLGGGVDSVIDSYLEADELRSDRVVSHVVVVRSPDALEQKVPKAGGGYHIVGGRVREFHRAARDTAKQLHYFRPDIILLHGFNATILGFALRRQLPQSLPIVSSYHGGYFAGSLGARVKAILFNKLELRFFRTHATAVIAVSHHSAAQLLASRVPAEKIIVLHNAVARGWPQRAHSDAEGRRNEVKLITVSRLAREKGIDVLLRAFALIAPDFPKLTLEIVGDGPLRKELATQVEKLGISGAANFMGNRSDVAMLLARADIFVMTSRQENHSVAILEAMRAGLPLVVSDVGGNPESVRDGLDGIIVPDFDVGAAAAAMSQLVSSGELRARLGASANARFKRDFESAVMIDRFLDVLTRLARTHGALKHG